MDKLEKKKEHYKIMIGEKIRSLREETKQTGQKLSQGKLAEKLGMSEDSRATVVAWEKGKKLPTTEQIIELCDIFDCQPGYFFGDFDAQCKEVSDIMKYTGLTEQSVEFLHGLKMAIDLGMDSDQYDENSGIKYIAIYGRILEIINDLLAYEGIDNISMLYSDYKKGPSGMISYTDVMNSLHENPSSSEIGYKMAIYSNTVRAMDFVLYQILKEITAFVQQSGKKQQKESDK